MSTPIYVNPPGLRLPDAPSQPVAATETADLLRQLLDIQKEQLALARAQAANQDQIARYGIPARAVLDLIESIGAKPLGEVIDRPAVPLLDHASHAVRHLGRQAHLTPTEFRLMAMLFEHRGAVVRRHRLIAAGWPYGELVHQNTLDAYVGRLRGRLRAVDSDVSIETLRGVGYRIPG